MTMNELMAKLQESVDKLHGIFERTDLETEWKKIRQKMQEARYNPGDIRPIADCMFSLLLAAKNHGFSVEAVFKEFGKVADENLRRRWKKMEDGTYQSF